MIPLSVLILFLSVLLSGCAIGANKVFVEDGRAKLAVPFDFPFANNEVSKEQKMQDEMKSLEYQKQSESLLKSL